MREPRVSVVVPTYNRAHFLPATIDSVLAQSFEDLELIVIDDGSTDATTDIVSGYGDPRLVVCSLAHSGHLSRLRNRGLRLARGRYVAFLDSDDLWHTDKLRLQVDLLDRYHDVGMSLCGFEVFDADGVFVENLYPSLNDGDGDVTRGRLFPAMMRGEVAPCISTLLFRHDCLGGVGLFDEGLRVGDHEFLARLALHSQAVILHRPLVRVRKHEGNMSCRYEVEGFEQVLCSACRFYSSGDISRDVYGDALTACRRGLTRLLLDARRWRQGARNLWGCLRLVPAWVRAWTLYVSSRPRWLS